MTKTILVAGGAGFIGSHLCDHLFQQGHRLLILDNLVTGRRQNIEHLLGEDRVQLFEKDINATEPLQALFDTPIDEIYNLASPASPKDFSGMPKFILMTGAFGQRNLLELATAHKASLLFASTSEVYGDAEVHPQPESYFGNVNPIGERSCYDEAKRFGEALCMAYLRENQTDIRIARIFNTYGPRMAPQDGRIMPNFFSQALRRQPLTVYGDGRQTRSYCFVSDMVNGLVKLMHSGHQQPINIGTSEERTVLEMAQIINELTNNPAGHELRPLPENDPKQRRPDSSRAASILQWSPQVSLEEGLAQTYSYFKSELAHSRPNP